MKKIVLMLTLLLSVAAGYGQTAKAVLDKCAATVSSKDGVTASFSMESAQYGSAKGTIAVKGKKFKAVTEAAAMWFDGKTLWTYVSKNDEVNVTTPTEAKLQALNPYNFINLYKSGFKYTMTQSSDSYIVHLTAEDGARRIQELFITVNKKSYAPTEVKMLQKQKWTTFTVSNLKSEKLGDDLFKFKTSEYPSAEVVDLR